MMTKEKELDPLIKSTTIAIQCEPHQWRSWPSAQQTENERRRRGIWSQRSARKFVQVQTSRHTTSSRLYLSFGYFIFHPPLFFFFQIVICFVFCLWLRSEVFFFEIFLFYKKRNCIYKHRKPRLEKRKFKYFFLSKHHIMRILKNTTDGCSTNHQTISNGRRWKKIGIESDVPETI